MTLIKRGFGTEREGDPQNKGLKRIGGLYKQICSIDNLVLAEQKARRKKSKQKSVQNHDRRRGCNILLLHEMLVTKTYATSPYTTFPVYEPKERIVYRLPFFPDRITHHAIINVLDPIALAMFTADTYSCIKGRGIHGAWWAVEKALEDEAGTEYCLKLDIKKFYPSVDHDILKALLRRKFKDNDLLWLLDEIIDSAEGLPIGNYLSMFLSNFYLTYFDHWIKESQRAKYYFRYMDDMVILAGTKQELHRILGNIIQYLKTELNLCVKENYQVYPVDSRGIDFAGGVFFHGYTLLRKSIKQNFARKMAKGAKRLTISAYWGWSKYANCTHLLKKLLPNEEFQRLTDCKGNRTEPGRRQNTNRQHPEQRDSSSGLQNKTIPVRERQQRQMPATANNG